jgi:hypothetical protein
MSCILLIFTDNRIVRKIKTTSFQPDPEIMPILKKQAEIQDRSVSWLVNHYIKKGLEVDGLIKKEKKKSKV